MDENKKSNFTKAQREEIGEIILNTYNPAKELFTLLFSYREELRSYREKETPRLNQLMCSYSEIVGEAQRLEAELADAKARYDTLEHELEMTQKYNKAIERNLKKWREWVKEHPRWEFVEEGESYVKKIIDWLKEAPDA